MFSASRGKQATNEKRSQSRIGRPALGTSGWLAVAALFAVGAASIVLAQPVPLGGFRALRGPAVAAPSDSPDVDRSEKAYPGGAPLKTDPELERLLARADLFVTEERYDLAAVLWQKVLDDTGDTLVTRDGRTYTSLADEVERTLSKLPPEGLKVYRITADGEAQAVLAAATGEREEEGLSEVVRRFFVSSHGDDAAYKLGCLALDRYDFVGASRLFGKILEQHPDPSVPKAEVLLRLAVASARVGDATAAAGMLDEIEKVAGPKPSFRLTSLVKQDLDRTAGSSLAQVGSSLDWPMALGSPARRGHMKGLSAKFMKSRLTEAWGFEFPMGSSGVAAAAYGASTEIMIARRTSGRVAAAPVTNEQLVPRWKSQGWRPSGQLLIAGGKVYFKTNNDLTCWDASAGKDDPVWRTAWLNNFQLDTLSQQLSQMYMQMGMQGVAGTKPATHLEVMLFGDQVHQSMSMSHGLIYNIEGPRVPRHGGDGATSSQQQPMRPYQYGVIPRRARKNWLAAYDAQTGKARWHRSASDSEKGDEADLGFLAAPVPYGNLLLVPVTDGGTMWLYGLARADGKTVWKSYLCDEPSGGCSPWSPIGVSVDGRDAYVLCGAGVVFSLDAVSGQIRFAVRYKRDGKDNPQMRNMGYQASMLELNGWGEDMIIPYGRTLVVMASDHDRIFAIDRRTGKFLWDSPRAPFGDDPASYCLGVHGADLYVAGKNVVRKYAIEGGKIDWSQRFDDSFGRGALTDNAIYMPIGNSLARMSLNKGEITHQVDVSLTSGHPVGNIYSDGEKLWALGANRFYALTDLDTRLTVLARRIAEGDAKSQFDRMLLRYTLQDYDAAVADMLAGFSLVDKKSGPADAADALFRSMNQIQLAQARPIDVLKILAEKFIDAPSQTPLAEDLQKQRGDLAYAALRSIRSQKTPGAAGSIIKIVPLLNQDYLLTTAGQALAVTSTTADAQILKTATESGPPAVRIVAAETLARLTGDAAKETLRSMLSAEQESVRLAAARALANLGDRDSLAVFVKLLESQDVKIRSRSIQSLKAFTQEKLSFGAYDAPEARATAVKAWQAWLAKEGQTVALKFPLPEVEQLLGRTLVAHYGQNLVIDYDSQGKETWRKSDIPHPWSCQGLPNGHRLIACYSRNMVVEYDDKGNQFWVKEGLPGNPFSAQRLPDGNTLVACTNSSGGGKIVELRPDGSTAWEASVTGNPRDARRLDDGRTLVALHSTHKVVEIDSSGRIVWTVERMQGASTAQRLDNGNTLIACMSGRRVVEVDRDGKEVWKKEGLNQVHCAQRLANGNTLVAEQSGVTEYDASGQAVGTKLGTNGASGVSRY